MANGDTILVVLGPTGAEVPGKPGATRIFHEFDDSHPGGPYGGEALVTTADPQKAVRVGYTRAVREALASGLLKDVTQTGREGPPPPQMAAIMDAAPSPEVAAAQATKK